MRDYADLILIAENTSQLNEGVMDSIRALASKIKSMPNISQYIKQAQGLKQQALDIVKSSQSGQEVMDKLKALAQQNQPVAEGLGFRDQMRHRKAMQTDITMNRAGSLAATGASATIGFLSQAIGLFDGIITHLHQGGGSAMTMAGGVYAIAGMLAGLVLAVYFWNKANEDTQRMNQLYPKQPAAGDAKPAPASPAKPVVATPPKQNGTGYF